MLSHHLLNSRPLATSPLLKHSALYTTMSSPANFKLDRTIFNEKLYSSIRSFWFAGLPEGSILENPILLKRWWGMGRTAQESTQFDIDCHSEYGHALAAIDPTHLQLPPFTSYADDLANSDKLAAPFLPELQQDSPQTLLSLLILLDQIPRNTHRTLSSLPTVYRHYDRLALALLRSSPAQPLITHHLYNGSAVHRNWFALPGMHAEDLSAQDLCLSILSETRQEASGNPELEKSLDRQLAFGQKHRDIIAKFGRFPHRNECLGRSNTPAEDEWLREGGDTFGVSQKKKD